jgi:hypothetical protein
MDAEGDRIYTEEDYAAKETLPDEWAADSQYAAADWTDDAALPDEAFVPDSEDESFRDEWAAAPAADFYTDDYVPLFEEENDFSNDLDPLDDELLSEEEQSELRRSHWQLLSGLADFAGVILGTGAILLLVMLLVSLINWLVGDLSQSFILLQKNF